MKRELIDRCGSEVKQHGKTIILILFHDKLIFIYFFFFQVSINNQQINNH